MYLLERRKLLLKDKKFFEIIQKKRDLSVGQISLFVFFNLNSSFFSIFCTPSLFIYDRQKSNKDGT